MFPASTLRPRQLTYPQFSLILRDALPCLVSALWLNLYETGCTLKSAISISDMPCAFEKISLLDFCAALFLRGADI
jgi:hypothetical protein